MEQFIQVSRDKFFEKINTLDVHPTPIGNYPYTSLWKLRSGTVIGKSVDYFKDGIQKAFPLTKYFFRILGLS